MLPEELISGSRSKKPTPNSLMAVFLCRSTPGGNYLRRATALGYECQQRYIEERVAFELPGFQADFDNRARWEIRICPSTEAAAEVIALLDNEHAVVAWLRRPPQKDTLVNFKPCEAVVIKGYLGEYTLIKIIQ